MGMTMSWRCWITLTLIANGYGCRTYCLVRMSACSLFHPSFCVSCIHHTYWRVTDQKEIRTQVILEQKDMKKMPKKSDEDGKDQNNQGDWGVLPGDGWGVL